jgi:hypothetical protein
MNTETFDWAEMAAMLSPQKRAPAETPAELVVTPRQCFNYAEERQLCINLGYPGLAEHFFNEHRYPDRAGTDCACYYCRFTTVTTPMKKVSRF